MQKKVPYVAQLGNMDCSIACMTMLFRYYGLDVDIVDVGQVVHIGRDGVNLTQLKQATQQFGFKCTAYKPAAFEPVRRLRAARLHLHEWKLHYQSLSH